MQRRAFFLLEVAIALVVLAIFLTMVPAISTAFRTLRVQYFARELGMFVSEARWQAVARHSAVTLSVSGNVVQASANGRVFDRRIPPAGISVSVNRPLGFTYTGNTQTAGTFTISDGDLVETVALGVGFGQVSYP